jgi:ABC-type transport system substrate-binding protein
MSQAAPAQPFTETIELNGPMINEVIFSVYHGGGAQWAAMVDGLIDIGNAPISPQERIGIEVNAWEADAFWGIACSTHFDPFFIEEPYGLPAVNGFPFNYLAMRRAVAIALDKYDLAQDSFGESGVALDHIIPASFSAWQESDLPDDFRRGDINRAIQVLEDAGFVDYNLDGRRDAPGAVEVNLTLYYFPMEWASKATQHSKISTNTTRLAEIIGTTMEALGFGIEIFPVTEQTLWDYTHVGYRSYQMALIPLHVPERAPDILKGLFHSMTIPIVDPPWAQSYTYTTNIMNFHNTTVDTLIETMNITTDYDDYQDLLSQLQIAIAENQPLIPLCTNYQYTAQRTNRFEDWFNEPGKGAANTWSLLHANLRTGQPDLHPISGVGGIMQFGLHSVPDSLNPVLATLDDSFLVLDSMYSRLIRMDPITGKALPDLAHAWRIEPEGMGLRITFFLHDNATWHDGESFTADDVAFTYDYLNNLPGPWPYTWSKPHIEFSNIEVIDNETLVIHTPLNGYFAIFDIASTLILPQHLWEGILQPAYFSNPRPVGTGPFRFDKQPEPGLIYLEYFPEYHYGLIGSREVAGYVDISFLIWLSGGIFLIAMTVVGAYWFLRPRPHGFES